MPLITAWSGVQSLASVLRTVVAVVVVVVAGAVEVPVVVSRVVVAGAVELVRTGSSTNFSLSMVTAMSCWRKRLRWKLTNGVRSL